MTIKTTEKAKTYRKAFITVHANAYPLPRRA